MNILLARHGETPWNQEGRYQGHTDIPLAPTGEQQARALGQRLKEIEIVQAVASPLMRARRTAQLILGERPLALRFEDGFKEISHGAWEGKLAADIAVSDPLMFHAWKTGPKGSLTAGPGAETLDQVLSRAWIALRKVTENLGATETVLVVAHDAVNRVILCRILGIPFEKIWSFRQAPAALNVLSGPTIDELQVVRLNDSDHVAPLFQEAVHKAV